ncbi:lytic transglycosylase domain-containing protein [Actinoplanes sp. NEAU-A12]|uniref:Lytic transglycosylase domain-containing protein n=1 Tax=Actinoplanes sandaracinus TaxID=3045177 RepID=A0ABT6WJ13_9ACTN|nr:lytic transglycosylase domain-containing protein [Actinoplanes sandaracinus]MDI6099724.1 lytic transglycosylase domain-containing protein [Actinoplanes sandaracinus]
MKRLWSRLGVRAASVGLLVAGLTGGVYLGQNRDIQQQGAQAQMIVQANQDEMQLLKDRQADHAAARAHRVVAEEAAAAKAATEVQVAASKARALEKKVIEAKKAEEAKKTEKAAGPVVFTGDIPSSCNEYNGSRKIGCALMLDAGFKLDQFPCLDKLWKKESGWNYKATNRSSGAYGIPQSLPGSKMASAGSDWKTNPATQIKWGLGYIEGRYKTPCGAWGHSQNVGWY